MSRVALAIAALAWMLAGSAWSAETDVRVGVRQNIGAKLISPDGPGPYPGVLVLETSRGLGAADIAFARALAQQGYVCLIPAYLEAHGVTAGHRSEGFTSEADQIYADLADAADMLSRSEKVRGSKVGAVGFSNGGFFATWLAATHKVSASISYYGAITGAGTDPGLSRFQKAFTASSAPLLLLVGTEDSYDGPTHHLVHILREANSPFQAEFYKGAHHEFDRRGGSVDPAAAKDAWTRTLAFFAEHLKAP
jgi:carboxymethylenebutenolidase